jgi:hypothetical protein
MDPIRELLLRTLIDSPRPDPTHWPAAYERIVGACACFLAAYPTFIQRSRAIMDSYHTDVRLRLPELLQNALQEDVAVAFHSTPLKWWSCGLFFNTAISRVANALEKTLATVCCPENDSMSPRDRAKRIVSEGHPTNSALRYFSAMPNRNDLDAAVIEGVAQLCHGTDTEALGVLDFDCVFSAQPELYERIALWFMWRDANLQKHRVTKARGSAGSSDSSRDPRIQFTLGMRSFIALCGIYAFLRVRTPAS